MIKEYGNLPNVECCAGQLNQVFMNILANAVDALESALASGICANPQIHIITLSLASERIVIKIADNGMGIPPDIQQRLFDPFFTTKPVGKGTGMGLSISYQIITQKHNGSLQCISKPELGAEFVIEIPLRQTQKGTLL